MLRVCFLPWRCAGWLDDVLRTRHRGTADADALQQVAQEKLGKRYLGADPNDAANLWMHVRVGFMVDARDARNALVQRGKIVQVVIPFALLCCCCGGGCGGGGWSYG